MRHGRLVTGLSLLLGMGGPVAGEARLDLSGGFLPDPMTRTMTVTASLDAQAWVRGCRGFGPEAPALVVELSDPIAALRFGASGTGLAGLVIAGPDAVYRCALAQEGEAAFLRVDPQAAGPHAVWPLLSRRGDRAEVAVWVSELDGPTAAGLAVLNGSAPPAFGLLAFGGSLAERELVVSGDVSARDIDAACTGLIASGRPDVTVRTGTPVPALVFSVLSPSDTTLVVLSPSGVLHCGDDGNGWGPVLRAAPAEAGDWGVWVGHFETEGAPATLIVGRDAGAVEARLAEADNPFRGRRIASAVAVLEILMAERDLGRTLSYGRIESEGQMGFTLHEVVLRDPSGLHQPLEVAELRVQDLDLAGLAAIGVPERFSVGLHGIGYAALVAAGRARGWPPLPPLAGARTVSLDMGLAPVAGEGSRRDLSVDLRLDGRAGLGVRARLIWPEAPGPVDLEAMPIEAVTFDLRDTGFLNAVLTGAAASRGVDADDLIDGVVSALGGTFGPDTGLAALREALAKRAEPGALTVTLATDDPRGLEAVLADLETDPAAAGRLRFDARYTPMP